MVANSLAMQKAAAWVNYQVEREGIARLTILILVLTTVGMLSFTWGYAEVSLGLLQICPPTVLDAVAVCSSHAGIRP